MVAAPTPSSHANGFLFADLRDYTRFVEVRGDQAAAELLAAYRALVRAEVERHRGAEIRTEGDSFYVVFPSASGAIRCGLAILDAARAASKEDPGRPIRVGIGVHAGETAETAEGLVGSAVNIAARVCAQAQAGELLVTDTVRGLTRTALPYGFVPAGTRRLKGIAEPVPLYRVVAEGASATERRRALPIPSLDGSSKGALLGGLAVVVLLGLAGVATLSFRPGQTSPSTSPTNGAVVSPPSAEATFPTPAERDLLSRLPLTVYQPGQTNCGRAAPADALVGATVSIRCELPVTEDASSVIYDQFAAQSAMDAVLLALEGRYRLLAGDCSKRSSAWQHWELPGSFAGTLLCYQDEAGHSWASWTYDGQFILARATRQDANNWQKLDAWWARTSVLMRR